MNARGGAKKTGEGAGAMGLQKTVPLITTPTTVDKGRKKSGGRAEDSKEGKEIGGGSWRSKGSYVSREKKKSATRKPGGREESRGRGKAGARLLFTNSNSLQFGRIERPTAKK